MKTAQENCEIFFHQILNVPERVSNANGLYLLRNSAQFRAIPRNSAQFRATEFRFKPPYSYKG